MINSPTFTRAPQASSSFIDQAKERQYRDKGYAAKYLSGTPMANAMQSMQGTSQGGSLSESYGRMIGGNMGGLLQAFLAAREGAAKIDQSTKRQDIGSQEASDIRSRILELELQRPSGERDRMLTVLRSKLSGIR